MLVDTHTHVITPDADRYPLDALEPSGGWYREHAVTVEELLSTMDGAGVDAAVLVQAVSAYRFDNDYVLDAARVRADRCVAVVCLDTDVPGAADELARLTRTRRARGLRWWALGQEDLGVRSVWTELARLGIPVVVTMFSARLPELAALLPTLPPVPIAVDHCAFADFARGVPDELQVLGSSPNVHLKVSTIVLDGMAEHGDVRDGLAELASCFGPGRLMWGSDFSQTHDREYAELAELARASARRLGDDARESFLGRAALRLWPDLAR
jgi:predicted TIM-barrel fold metal-dependent hydrolase